MQATMRQVTDTVRLGLALKAFFPIHTPRTRATRKALNYSPSKTSLMKPPLPLRPFNHSYLATRILCFSLFPAPVFPPKFGCFSHPVNARNRDLRPFAPDHVHVGISVASAGRFPSCPEHSRPSFQSFHKTYSPRH